MIKLYQQKLKTIRDNFQQLVFVNDMAGSPGPLPLWGFNFYFVVVAVTAAFKLGIPWVAWVAIAQFCASLVGGWWLIRLTGISPVPKWKGDTARLLFLYPMFLFIWEMMGGAVVVLVWWLCSQN